MSSDRKVREAQAAKVWDTSRALVEQSHKLLALSRALCSEVTYHATPLAACRAPVEPEAGVGQDS